MDAPDSTMDTNHTTYFMLRSYADTEFTRWVDYARDFVEALDGSCLSDENGEHEPMEFVPKAGSGTCKMHDCDGSFSAVNRPVWRCDCGAFMTQYTDATTYHKPRFCPNCGRKAVER